ncbi:hypothetical protein AOC05_10790 [Arthrobacter alpinus]|uniref:Uncharacterized protein n=2 Tax=Arthrobacter alpinus TaxID=656366 RepID=A0A0M4QGA1_9MICC|nr:hypothetical protein AOC05_10790 [Arthrobacter alpinus]
MPIFSMLVVVAVGVIMPLRNSFNFYYWDDTAGAAVGVWQRIAEQILAGHLPLLQIDMWRGGNFAAESATGLFNPVMVGLMLGTYPIDNLALAISVAKFALFFIMAIGAYFLARAYGARPWASAIMGAVLPISGYNLFMDGTAWINGTAIMAFTPWLWWSVKRYVEGRTPIFVVVLMVYLLGSTGNPYGLLAAAAVIAACCIEAGIQKNWKAFRTIVLAGALGALACVLIYLPFVLTSSVGVRADSTTFNDEFFSPNLSDIMGLSTGSFQIYVRAFGLPYFTVPVAYLAWFVMPLLPWIKYKSLAKGWKIWSSAIAFGIFYLFLVLGPSNLGMFRWPLRLIPFFYLALLLIFTLALDKGWGKDKFKLRASLSFGIVIFGVWLAWSDRPGPWKWHALFALVTLILVALFVWRRPTGRQLFMFLGITTLLVLFMQTSFMKTNDNVANYNFPQSRSAMKSNFDAKYKGLTVVVANRDTLPAGALAPDRAWKDILFGNMFAAVGVESTTSYSGIGFTKLDNALCASYYGGSCVDAWASLWQKPAGSSFVLADMMRVQTVVRWNDPVPESPGSPHGTDVTSPPAPEGWTKVSEDNQVSVYTRDAPFEFEEGRVSTHGADVQVNSNVSLSDTRETANVSATDGNDRIVSFARLNWPGYTATLDDNSIPVMTGPAGLLQVEVPAGTQKKDLVLSFTPPGFTAGIGALALALLGTIGLEVWDVRRRRKAADVLSNGNSKEIRNRS